MGTVYVPSRTLCLISGVANGDICFLDRKRLKPKELLWQHHWGCHFVSFVYRIVIVLRHLCGTVYRLTFLIFICFSICQTLRILLAKNREKQRICTTLWFYRPLWQHKYDIAFMNDSQWTYLKQLFLFHYDESQTRVAMTNNTCVSFWWTIVVSCWQLLIFVMLFQHWQ